MIRFPLSSRRTAYLRDLASVAVAVLPSVLSAQVIRGKVVEFRSDLPIARAQIALLDDKQQETQIVSSADSLGRYSIVVPTPGRYFVRARQSGYDEYLSIPKRIGPRDTVTLDLWPQANADLLDSLLKMIKPGTAPTTPEGKAFDRRLRSRLGHVIVRERIVSQRYYDLEEVITRAFDGVQVQRSRGDLTSICYRGCCTFAVYRNGVRSFAMTGARTSVLQLQSVLATRAEAVYAVEFYVGQTEMPPEYFGETPAACGVLGYWTRPPA